jgi:HJR/Mrr/RecB family endonuclease
MSGEAWSCFAQLPSGLVDPERALTLNWLRPKPTPEGFEISRRDLDVRRYARIVWVQRAALAALLVLGSSIGLIVIAEWPIDRRSLTGAIGASAVLALIVVLTAQAIIRFRQVEPRRDAYDAAVREFAEIDAWRAKRCDGAYWAKLDAVGFELESAELLAGVFGTGQVTLTQAMNGYGVDILACAPAGRIIAQCKAQGRKVGAAEVRELAGAKSFFKADQAIMISLKGASEESEQVNRMAERLELTFWNADALVAWAKRLRSGG